MVNLLKHDFQVMGVLLQDLVLTFPNKNFYIWSSLTNVSSFILIISLFIFLFNIRTLFLYLIAIELLLLSSVLNFVSYLYFYDSLESELIIYYTLTIAVAESAFGLGLLLRIFKNKGSLDPSYLNDLA